MSNFLLNVKVMDMIPTNSYLSRSDTDTDKEIQRRGVVVYPLKVVKKEIGNHLNLLLTEQGGCRPYSAITNFTALVSSQCNKNGHKIFHCYSCLHGFVPKKGVVQNVYCYKNTRNIINQSMTPLRVYTKNSKHRLLCTQTSKAVTNIRG